MILYLTLFLGLWIILKTLLEINKGKSSQGWSTTQGVVTHTGILNWRSTYRMSTSSSAIAYFQYEYTVNGEKLIGTRIFSGDFFLSMLGMTKPINQAVQTYTAQQTVTVYYNPAKPSESLLQPGVRQVLYWGFAIGVGILAAGFIYAAIASAQAAAQYGSLLISA